MTKVNDNKMKKTITTLNDLKEFLNSLNDEQLRQKAIFAPEEEAFQYAWQAQVLQEDLVYDECDLDRHCLPRSEAIEAEYEENDLAIAFPAGSVLIDISKDNQNQ